MEHRETIPSGAAAGRLALDEFELFEWGKRLGMAIDPPLVIALSGDLGSGKTTLARAICQGYGVTADVTSPTFTLVHEYAGFRSTVYHLDLYRLRSARELESLGWDELLQAAALIIVEWPERAAELLPPGHIPISLLHLPKSPERRLLYAGGHT